MTRRVSKIKESKRFQVWSIHRGEREYAEASQRSVNEIAFSIFCSLLVISNPGNKNNFEQSGNRVRNLLWQIPRPFSLTMIGSPSINPDAEIDCRRSSTPISVMRYRNIFVWSLLKLATNRGFSGSKNNWLNFAVNFVGIWFKKNPMSIPNFSQWL